MPARAQTRSGQPYTTPRWPDSTASSSWRAASHSLRPSPSAPSYEPAAAARRSHPPTSRIPSRLPGEHPPLPQHPRIVPQHPRTVRRTLMPDQQLIDPGVARMVREISAVDDHAHPIPLEWEVPPNPENPISPYDHALPLRM